MKLEEIEKEWAIDCEINKNDLTGEALKIPKLHAKWHKYLNAEKQTLYKLRQNLTQLEHILERYYSRTLLPGEMVKYGLKELPDVRLPKPEMAKAISSHTSMVELKLMIGTQSDKVDFITDIIKSIHGRGYLIRDAIEWCKYQAGN